MVESEDVERALDALDNADAAAREVAEDLAARLDPFGDHRAATQQAIAGEMLAMPEGMDLRDASMGVIP